MECMAKSCPLCSFPLYTHLFQHQKSCVMCCCYLNWVFRMFPFLWYVPNAAPRRNGISIVEKMCWLSSLPGTYFAISIWVLFTLLRFFYDLGSFYLIFGVRKIFHMSHWHIIRCMFTRCVRCCIRSSHFVLDGYTWFWETYICKPPERRTSDAEGEGKVSWL